MVHRRFFKTIKVGENSSEVPRHFKKEKCSKKDEKNCINHIMDATPMRGTMHPCTLIMHGSCLMFPCTPVMHHCAFLRG